MLSFASLPLLLLPLLSAMPSTVRAAKAAVGESCEYAAVHLDTATLALDSGCDATSYCSSDNICVIKGCRRDEYPYGYGEDVELPPRCDVGYACPDEMDACQPQAAVGEACQLDRDDECAPPPNMAELKSSLNVNGSICLNQVCHYSNVTEGSTCVVENVVFVGYHKDKSAFADIRSRDNCKFGFYCDGTSLICNKTGKIGSACSADKMCSSYNCGTSGKCVEPADTPKKPASWVYAIVAIFIILIIAGTLSGLFLLHRRSRKEYQVKLEQYYTEQTAYRNSLFTLGATRDSLLSLPKNTHPDVARQSLLVPNDHEVDPGYTR